MKLIMHHSKLYVHHLLRSRTSWVWRKLLKLHPIAYPFLRFEIRDGKTAFVWYVWYDDWFLQIYLFFTTFFEVGARKLDREIMDFNFLRNIVDVFFGLSIIVDILKIYHE